VRNCTSYELVDTADDDEEEDNKDSNEEEDKEEDDEEDDEEDEEEDDDEEDNEDDDDEEDDKEDDEEEDDKEDEEKDMGKHPKLNVKIASLRLTNSKQAHNVLRKILSVFLFTTVAHKLSTSSSLSESSFRSPRLWLSSSSEGPSY
jgi:hypothetical protein